MARQSPKLSATPHGLIRSGALLLFAFALVIIFLLHQPQANDKIGQSGATQCTKNTEQPKTFGQTLATDPTAFFTFGLFLVGAAQAILFLRQLNIISVSLADTKKAAKAAKRQARLARDSLIASNRAWIEPTVERSTSSLVINKYGASYALKIGFKNTGNVPATDIHVDAWLVGRAMKNSIGTDQTSPLIPHRSKCIQSRTEIRRKIGDMLFAGESFPRAQGYADVEIGCSMDADELRQVMFEENDRKCVVLYAGGAINYRFGTDSKVHQTSFLYEVTLKGAPCSFSGDQEVRSGDDIYISVVPEGDCRQAD